MRYEGAQEREESTKREILTLREEVLVKGMMLCRGNEGTTPIICCY